VDILKVINQETHLKKFGMIVRILRVRHRYTLRSLATQVGLSHAYLRKIELAQTTINRSVYDRLMSVFDFSLQCDREMELQFYEAWNTFNQSIIYLNRQSIESSFQSVNENREVHEQSLWMVEFYIMKLGYKAQNFGQNISELTQMHDELSSIENLMDPSLRQIYLIYKGNYYYHMNNPEENRKAFETILEMDTWNVYSAMAHYLLGLSYTMTFSLKRSNRYLWEAYEMFKRLNIEIRVETIRVFIEMNLMKMGTQDKTEHIFDKGLKIAKDQNLSEFARVINYDYAIYFLRNKLPKLALEKLDDIDRLSYQYYLYKAYAYSLLEDDAKVIEMIEEAFNQSIKLHMTNLVYYYGLNVLLAYHKNDDAKMRENVKPFFEECIRQAAYFEIDLAYKFYKNYLSDHRRYKDAYELSSRMITLTKIAFN